MIKKSFTVLFVIIFGLLTSSCFKTRNEVGQADQDYIYSKKQADNQLSEKQNSQLPVQGGTEAQLSTNAASNVDDRDELIRNLVGRVELLETKLKSQTESSDATKVEDAKKIELLQEALVKLEAQVQNLEDELASENKALQSDASDDDIVISKKNTNTKDNKKKLNSYEEAQLFFENQDWKKAILSFQKYTDESPKGKFIPEAKYKIGVCFQELGMKEEAMAFYEEVVANYSKTEAGKKSKTRLSSLKK